MTLTPTTVAAIRTAIAAGTCTGCGYVTAVTDTSRATRTARCGGCNAPVRLDYVRGTYNGNEPCNDQCQYATGPVCSCACGGDNHRAGYIAGADMIPVWVRDRDRDRHTAKLAAAAAKRVAATVAADTRRAAMIAETPALGVLIGDRYADSDSDFVIDMRALVAAGDELSPRRLAAVVRMVAADEARDTRRTARDAADAAARAAGVHHPVGKRVTFTGVVVSAKRHTATFGYSDKTVIKIVVKNAAGWAAYGTAPASLYPASYTCDTFQAWLDALPGQRIEVTAELCPGREGDPLFGVFKRPTARLVGNAPVPEVTPAGDAPCGCPTGPAEADPTPEAAAFAATVDLTGGALDAAVRAHRARPTVDTHAHLTAVGRVHRDAFIRAETTGFQARTHAAPAPAVVAPFVSSWGALAG